MLQMLKFMRRSFRGRFVAYRIAQKGWKVKENGEINSCLACSCENTLKLSLPLRASEVTHGSEVSPVGEVLGKLNFTASFCEQLHCVQHNFTFAFAKTSQTGKETTARINKNLHR